ncbi:hypothetical protein ES703_84239 [subsurface metagenome]
MAADTAGRLAGHDRQKALHPFYRVVVFIQGYKKQASQGRHFHVG